MLTFAEIKERDLMLVIQGCHDLAGMDKETLRQKIQSTPRWGATAERFDACWDSLYGPNGSEVSVAQAR